jgi:hypothetical protein
MTIAVLTLIAVAAMLAVSSNSSIEAGYRPSRAASISAAVIRPATSSRARRRPAAWGKAVQLGQPGPPFRLRGCSLTA